LPVALFDTIVALLRDPWQSELLVKLTAKTIGVLTVLLNKVEPCAEVESSVPMASCLHGYLVTHIGLSGNLTWIAQVRVYYLITEPHL